MANPAPCSSYSEDKSFVIRFCTYLILLISEDIHSLFISGLLILASFSCGFRGLIKLVLIQKQLLA